MERVFTKRSIKGLILLVCLFGLAQNSLATTVRVPSDVDMVVGARAIIRGKVLSVGSAIDENDNRIYTYITVRVNEVLKGQITTRRIVLKELGGAVDDRITVVYGSPRFTRGEKVLLYLDTRPDGSLKTHQMFLGKFNITLDSNTGQEFAVRSTPDENTTVLPADAHAHLRPDVSTERLELSAYTQLVREKLSSNLEDAIRFEQTHYDGIPTLAKPAEYSKADFGDSIQPQFALLSPTARWRESDTGQSIPYTLYTAPVSGVPVLNVNAADIAAAAGSWSTVANSGLRVTSAGSLSNCYVGSGQTGIHVVSNNCDGQNTPSPGCAGVLAWGGWSGGQFSPQVVNGVTFQYRITQGFVSCNPWAACSFGDACSVRFIVTHELGHALGFGHSAINQATMFAFAQAIARCEVLHTDDGDAARAVYPVPAGGGGPLSITTASPLPNGTVGTAYSQTLLATGGTTPYTWSLVSVAGQSLPPGVTLSASGTLSGNPTTAGTYNFTVQVRDSAPSPATVQKAFAITVSTASVPLDSQFISQNVPTSLTPGQQFNVSMQWRNTGTQTWSGSNFYFVTQNPAFNTTWGGPGGFNAVSLVNFVIGPGQLLDATFTMTAPTTPGLYNFQWQIFQDFGAQFFGQMSTNVAIGVGVQPPTGGTDTIGLFRPTGNFFFLRNSNSLGAPDAQISFGAPGDLPIVGDWDGDGDTTIGLYRPSTSTFFLRNNNTQGAPDIILTYGDGPGGDLPVAADWDGNGTWTIGIYRPSTSTFYLRNSNTFGVPDMILTFGAPGDMPLVGDWDGNGTMTIGLFRPSGNFFFLRNSNTMGAPDMQFSFGAPGDLPIVGDWDGDGDTTIGLFRPTGNFFFLRNANSSAPPDIQFVFGATGDRPIVGNWDGL
jgi:hypothetical protein